MRCSELSLQDGEPLAGTAPVASTWLLVEQELPWGRDALLESGIDKAVAEELSRRAKALGAKVVLVRRPGPRQNGAGPRRVFAAWMGADPFVQQLQLERDEQLLGLDLERLARGERLDGGTEATAALMLVCTNGRRDACCALMGRPAADALAAARPEQTWECSHLGGHRFAPTILALPSGACFGRLDPAGAVDAAAALDRGVLDLAHLRGIVGRPEPVQAAEAVLREELGLARLVDVTPLGWDEQDGVVEVRLSTAGGQEHTVVVRRVEGLPQTVSCGGEPEPSARWVVVR
jgi:hypothetical protein